MIPTRIKVGRTWYAVKRERLPIGLRGQWRYRDTIKQHTDIRVSPGDGSFGNYTEDEQQESFWHELTHAILHAIKRKELNDDEQFVTDFSSTLHKALKSAEFK